VQDRLSNVTRSRTVDHLELKLALDPIAERARKQLDHLQTEAATSTALVLPFLAALGYDVFDPQEVVPEFSADFGGKRARRSTTRC